MDSVLSANNIEAASSSNGDTTPKYQKAAAEDMYVDSRPYIIAAIKGNIEPFRDTERDLHSIVTPNKNTILHISIMSRTASTKFVEDILDRCPLLLFHVNVNGETPLHVAAKCGHSDMVKFLIQSTAKTQCEVLENGIGAAKRMLIGMTNKEGDTALHEAVRYKHLDVVKILTREDPDFSYSSNHRGETPLYIAAANNSLEPVAIEILKTCTSPAYEGPAQITALHAATINHGPDITRKILEKKESLIKETDQHGWTPLHYAAYHGNSETMKLLLECDVSTAFIGERWGNRTPLHIAVSQGYIPHVLISRCPDCCELVDEEEWNVLHYAMLSLTYKDLKILLKDPLIRMLINNKNLEGNTPLHLLATFRPKLVEEIGNHYVKNIFLDLHAVNRQNKSVVEVINSRYRQLENSQKEILKLEESVGPYKYGVVKVNKGFSINEERQKEIEKIKESHLIVAALIATVTFTAAFTLPGGVIQGGDKDEGTAILSKKSAFQAFVITDAIALVLSLSAVFAHFLMSLVQKEISTEQSLFLLTYGAYSTMIAMGAMGIAFVTGTYAVLITSLWLAILTTFIGLSFILLMFLIFRGMRTAERRYW